MTTKSWSVSAELRFLRNAFSLMRTGQQEIDLMDQEEDVVNEEKAPACISALVALVALMPLFPRSSAGPGRLLPSKTGSRRARMIVGET